MEYTKGEWKVGFPEDGTLFIRVRTSRAVRRIATIFDNREENLANAQLIAAAPDLYEALKALTTHFKLSPHLDNLRTGYDEDYIEQAERAIAKAEGK